MVCRGRRSKGPGVEFKVRGMGHVNFHVNSEAHVTSSVYSYMQRRTEKNCNFRSARSSYKVSPDWRPPLRFNKRTNNRNIPKIKRLFPVLRDRAAFLRLGGLNKMPQAFLARAACASVLGGSGDMLPRKIFKINASRMAKSTFQYSRHSEFFYYLSG